MPLGQAARHCQRGFGLYTRGRGDSILSSRFGRAIVWSRDWKKDYQLKSPELGVALHPLVDRNKLICVVGAKNTRCVTFDRYNGKEFWRALSARHPEYFPPVIYEIQGERQLIIWGSDAVSGLTPTSENVF